MWMFAGTLLASCCRLSDLEEQYRVCKQEANRTEVRRVYMVYIQTTVSCQGVSVTQSHLRPK